MEGGWQQIRIDYLDEPTRGIDVGAKYEIYKLMNDLVENQGKDNFNDFFRDGRVDGYV